MFLTAGISSILHYSFLTEFQNLFMHKLIASEQKYAGLFRRLFAIFYDCILLVAILFILSAIATTLNNGKAVEPGDAIYPFFVILVVALSYLYFAWFWMGFNLTSPYKRVPGSAKKDLTLGHPGYSFTTPSQPPGKQL